MGKETPHDRFLRIGTGRLEKAETAIVNFKKVADRGRPHYEWTENEAREAIERLQKSIDDAAAAFGLEEHDKKLVTVCEQAIPESKLDRATVAWALDKLLAGRTQFAIDLLKNALKKG